MSKTHVLVAGWVAMVGALAIVVVHHLGLSVSLSDSWLVCSAFAAPIGATAILALAGVYTDHPPLWLFSGIALAVSSIVWPIAIPLLFPAVVMICTESDRFRMGVPAVLAGSLAGLFGYLAIKEGPLPSFGRFEVTPLFDNSGQAVAVLTVALGIAFAGALWGLLTEPA